MAPKKEGDQSSTDMEALCVLMATATEFNPDYNAVATALGVSHAKNVPRKFDSILKPHGYAIKNKKIVKIGENGEAVDPPATPKATPAKKGPKTPKTPKGSPTKKVVKIPASKKRKVEEVISEEDDVDETTKDESKTTDESVDGKEDDEA